MEIFKQKYDACIGDVEEPHLFIYLRSSTETVVERINRRGRDFESSMDIDFLINLSQMYDEMFENLETEFRRSKVLVIQTDNLNAEQVFSIAKEHILANYFEAQQTSK